MFGITYRLVAVLAVLLAALPAGADTLGRARAKMQEAEQALAEADTAAQANRQRAAEHRAKAEALLQEALGLYKAAGAPASHDAVLVKEYAGAQEQAGNYDLAAEALEHAVALAPQDPALWRALGTNLVKAGPYARERAFEALRRALALDHTSKGAAEAEFFLGRLYEDLRLHDFARNAYARSLKLDPDAVRATLSLAALKVRSGAVAEAEADIQALGKAAMPYDAETRVLLREALADFELLQHTFKDTAENHGAYARLLYRAARFPEAVLAARRAVKLAPADTGTRNFLAAVQLQLGNLPQAVEAYKASLAANPEQPRIREQLQRVEAQLERAAGNQRQNAQPASPDAAEK